MTRPPTEMEMRVAEAMANESAPWINCLSDEQALALTRVAIRAMRKPTIKMVTAAINSRVVGRPSHALLTWRPMIDAASPPQTE